MHREYHHLGYHRGYRDWPEVLPTSVSQVPRDGEKEPLTPPSPGPRPRARASPLSPGSPRCPTPPLGAQAEPPDPPSGPKSPLPKTPVVRDPEAALAVDLSHLSLDDPGPLPSPGSRPESASR